MNSTKQNLYICIILIILSKHCCGIEFFTSGSILRIYCDKAAIQAAAPIVADLANKLQAGLTSLGTGIGIGTGVGLTIAAIIGGSYYGYCRYCDYCIQQEQLRIALRNATIRNNILIGTTATASSIGIGYAIYRLYKSIVTNRQQKQHEQELFAAKSNLLDALATANHDDKGQFELPTSCTTHVCKLLELPGGNQALSTIVSAYRKPILQQAESSTAMLAQPN
jgi:F0F1-type ATP synthase membrane subunit c/vacuolar-type H+-ATPase subunit K